MVTLWPTRRRASTLTTILGLAIAVNAHSWIEYGYKLDSNGTMVGNIGYPRGYLPRNSTNPLWKDAIPELLLPYTGDSAYTGSEIINKYPLQTTPEYPMLEAAPGDYVALMHYENGHTTLPQNQPLKPHNRGTIYLYGTSKPAGQEKLFDVHLLWNQNGTGGDKRGVLLATRNYDDGQCYQPNNGPLSEGRAAELASDGAKHDEELACQSDIKLPDNLEPGSIYTIYWYWDWPDLNAAEMDVNATTNGLYPWAGSFMRGDPNPHHYTMSMISKNESYSSVMDIKITDKISGISAKQGGFVASQDVYSKGIQAQMESNFQVNMDDSASGGSSGGAGSSQVMPTQASTAETTATSTSTNPAGSGSGSVGGSGVTTVVIYSTVPPTTVFRTVFRTSGPESQQSEPSSTSSTTHPQHTSTVVVTRTVHVPAGQPTATAAATPTSTPMAKRSRRAKWRFDFI